MKGGAAFDLARAIYISGASFQLKYISVHDVHI